jgi:hypothetical protein
MRVHVIFIESLKIYEGCPSLYEKAGKLFALPII